MILSLMRNALSTIAVKYMGQNKPIPELEFVMHPNKAADAKLESRIGDQEMMYLMDGSWEFHGVPIREDIEQSTWTLAPKRKPNEPS